MLITSKKTQKNGRRETPTYHKNTKLKNNDQLDIISMRIEETQEPMMKKKLLNNSTEIDAEKLFDLIKK